MAESMRCVVAIPTRELFGGMITYANIPSVEGYYGVLPNHEMIVAANMPTGVLTLTLEDGSKEEFLLSEGASQFSDNILTVLGRFGKNVKDIDLEEAQEKAEGIRKQIEEAGQDPEDEQVKAMVENSKNRLRWYEAQIDYAKNHAN